MFLVKAQGIMDSLTVLASLRPRSSDGSDTLPLIPPASVLHKLHRTLPVGACAGWYGTLPGSRSTALRDDTTVRVRAGATIHSVISAAPAVGSTVSAAGATTAATVYPGFPYPNYGGQQYRGGGYTYKPGQGAPYYPATYGVPTQGQVGGQGQGQGQTGGTGYYPNQGYGGAGQQAYAYSSWYNYQAPATAGTSSGRGTPQPGTNVSGASGMATNYAGFFNAQTTGAGQRAVANTVVSSKGGGYGQGTIAVHLRNTSGYQQQSYGTYQQASSTTGAK
jgi:hypothetical protein